MSDILARCMPFEACCSCTVFFAYI
uniref:Uncharacterized protein n=1 Tax=Arundo donax TaxID=35708 RepID=A0A0A9BEV1_ARUDO